MKSYWIIRKKNTFTDRDKFFIKCLNKGIELEKSLITKLKDKKFNTFSNFRSCEYLSSFKYGNRLGYMMALETFLRDNGFIDFKMTSKISNTQPEYVSMFSYYNYKGIKIFPYLYLEDKYVVYKADYELLTMDEILDDSKFEEFRKV